jgi:hypothetical protein
MTNPAEHTGGSNPEARRDDEPEDTAQEGAVVDLPDAWNEEG